MIMEAFRIVLHCLGQLLFGTAIIGLCTPGALKSMSRVERISVAMLTGMLAQSFLILMSLFAGLELSGWSYSLLSLAGAVIALSRPNSSRLVLAGEEDREFTGPQAVFVIIAALALVVWMVPAALIVPTIGYDGMAIWGYRVRVLFAERTIFTESLRDPLRMISQPLHPYLFPVLETGYCIAGGRFVSQWTHIPHIIAYLSHILFAIGVSGRLTQNRRWLGLAAITLMSAISMSYMFVSAREPFMATLALVGISYLAKWVEEPKIEFLAISAFFVLMTQQVKVDGLALAGGWGLGTILVLLSRCAERITRLRQLAFVGLICMLAAIPWAVVKSGIPPAHYDLFMTDYTMLARARLEHFPFVARMILAELFTRPELYGLSGWLALAMLVTGWKKENAVERVVVLLPPLIYLGALFIMYALRQDQLPVERNMSISRRITMIMPALVYAAFWLPASFAARRSTSQAAASR